MAELRFKRRRLISNKLEPYGFERVRNGYYYKALLMGGAFSLEVHISENETVTTHLYDANSGDEYVLHLVEGSAGDFVGQVRQEYNAVLDRISENCFETDVFKSEQARRIISYVREKYGDELEYLWQKFPDNAIWRRKDNNKWYAAILTVPSSKLGIKSDEIIEIIDLRIQPEKLEKLIDNKKYFPGWHMNKKRWYTICLDGTVPTEEICDRIDVSYELAVK